MKIPEPNKIYKFIYVGKGPSNGKVIIGKSTKPVYDSTNLEVLYCFILADGTEFQTRLHHMRALIEVTTQTRPPGHIKR